MAFGCRFVGVHQPAVSVFDDLLAALSRKLDVRELFQHLSAVICRIVPYDEAQLILLGEDGSPYSVRQNARKRSEGIAGDGSGDSRQ